MKFFRNHIIRLVLIFTFAGYYGSITLFPHYHVVDGVTIVHSHPFGHKPLTNNPAHQHSANGLVAIQLLSTLIVNVPCSCCNIIDPRTFQGDFVYSSYREAVFITESEYTIALRAPPASC